MQKEAKTFRSFGRGCFGSFDLLFVLALIAGGPARGEMRDAAGYPPIHAQCATPSKGSILTAVGYFETDKQTRLEVVADTRVTSTDGLSEYEQPSIRIFDRNCEILWQQTYPSLAEVGFEPMSLPGKQVLYVSAISVFQPADQIISEGEFLSVQNGKIVSELAFEGDRYDVSTFGLLGRSKTFVVGIIHNANPMRVRFDSASSSITAILYRWPAMDRLNSAEADKGHFGPPEQIGAKAFQAMKLPLPGPQPPFPLSAFVFGPPGPF